MNAAGFPNGDAATAHGERGGAGILHLTQSCQARFESGHPANCKRMIVLDTRQMLVTRAAEEYEVLLSRTGVCSLHEFEHHMRVIHMLNARIISYERL